jgi:mRNA interferase RelE/StbE
MYGSKKYIIEYSNIVVEDDIPQLPLAVKNMVKKAIEERLMIDPVGFGKPLRYSLKGHRRLHVSDYRVIYRIDTTRNSVFILSIKHRKKFMINQTPEFSVTTYSARHSQKTLPYH